MNGEYSLSDDIVAVGGNPVEELAAKFIGGHYLVALGVIVILVLIIIFLVWRSWSTKSPMSNLMWAQEQDTVSLGKQSRFDPGSCATNKSLGDDAWAYMYDQTKKADAKSYEQFSPLINHEMEKVVGDNTLTRIMSGNL